jgi:hypothetical protein
MDHSRGRLQCELKCSYGIRYHPSKLYQPASPYPRARIVCPRNYKFELPKAIISRLRQSARLRHPMKARKAAVFALSPR